MAGNHEAVLPGGVFTVRLLTVLCDQLSTVRLKVLVRLCFGRSRESPTLAVRFEGKVSASEVDGGAKRGARIGVGNIVCSGNQEGGIIRWCEVPNQIVPGARSSLKKDKKK